MAGSSASRSGLARNSAALWVSPTTSSSWAVNPSQSCPNSIQQQAMAVFPFVRAKDGDSGRIGPGGRSKPHGCGRPVVASDLPAIKDSVLHWERPAWWCALGNPEALADTIVFALQHSEKKWKRWPDLALKKVAETFDWDVVTEKYGRLLQREIEKQRFQ
ncbi:MAG: glycosyltransferase [Desulfotignum sp.]|nr:glycosyltransferase [Desulfotignum sp.]